MRKISAEPEYIGQPAHTHLAAEFLFPVFLPVQTLSDKAFSARNVGVAFDPHSALRLKLSVPECLTKIFKQSREAAGLTQETFAEMLGLGVKHISAMECGAVGVSLNTIRTICKVLAISSDTLLLENTDKNDVSVMAARLERLSLKQFRIAEDVLNKLIEAFALEENES